MRRIWNNYKVWIIIGLAYTGFYLYKGYKNLKKIVSSLQPKVVHLFRPYRWSFRLDFVLYVKQASDQSLAIQKGGKMERAYKFLQLTLLGLIVGILIILLSQLNYWAYDIKMTIRKSVVYQNNEKVRQFLDKNKKQPPACTKPKAPKYKI